jgi:hypothetical protein
MNQLCKLDQAYQIMVSNINRYRKSKFDPYVLSTSLCEVVLLRIPDKDARDLILEYCVEVSIKIEDSPKVLTKTIDFVFLLPLLRQSLDQIRRQVVV